MFQRRILHHGPDPHGPSARLEDRAVSGCWFDLHRQGGCGAGELVLRDSFPLRGAIDIGDWISFEATEGDRWYLGRVEERRAASPAEVRLRLEGMSIQLGEVFPGGFALDADSVAPHRFAETDLFPHDPDHSLEHVDSLASVEQLVQALCDHYVLPQTDITLDPARIETPRHPAPLASLKFRGEESVRTILKELALRAQASWGVDADGAFFFMQSRSQILATWREGRDLTSLHHTRDREHLFNRVLLTGDYVYDRLDATDHLAQRSFRWRGNYTQPESRTAYGDRRIRLWLPWIRTEQDALAFVREFFRIYSHPTDRYLIETAPQSLLPLPWDGRIRLEDLNGALLTVATVESLRVVFDHAPRFRVELGPEDPRNLWPEPPHDERWELPTGRPPGGPVVVTDRPSFSTDVTSDASSSLMSDASSVLSSEVSSDNFSDAASESGAPFSFSSNSDLSSLLSNMLSSENSDESLFSSDVSSVNPSDSSAAASDWLETDDSSVLLSLSLNSDADSSAGLGSNSSLAVSSAESSGYSSLDSSVRSSDASLPSTGDSSSLDESLPTLAGSSASFANTLSDASDSGSLSDGESPETTLPDSSLLTDALSYDTDLPTSVIPTTTWWFPSSDDGDGSDPSLDSGDTLPPDS